MYSTLKRRERGIHVECLLGSNKIIFYLNPFYPTGLFRYPLKPSENQRFSNVFKGIERDQRHEMG